MKWCYGVQGRRWTRRAGTCGRFYLEYVAVDFPDMPIILAHPDTAETLHSAREHLIIKEIQAAVGRELAARSEVPNTMPQRIADLLRELHRRLRNPNEESSAAF
jgi:predicted TIM-barrel fold metal-dependent hydrolase